MPDTGGPHHAGTHHPVPALVLHGRADDVTDVVNTGAVVVENRQLTSADEQALVADANDAWRN